MSLSNFLFLRKSIILCIFGMLFIFSGEVLANKGLEIALKAMKTLMDMEIAHLK